LTYFHSPHDFDYTVEHYTWQKPVTTVHNIIIGELYLDTHGDLNVQCTSTGARCALTLSKRGWRGGGAFRVDGVVTLPDLDEPLLRVSGAWDAELHADSPTGSTVPLWTRAPVSDLPLSYDMTLFATGLNDPRPIEAWPVLPTDARRRPDARALENGLGDAAAAEKERVERKQRASREARFREHGVPSKKGKDPWVPIWFVLSEGEWVLNMAGERIAKPLPPDRCPDIF
jgi:hypothetical protein